LFERFFRCGDLVLRAKAFALHETIPRPDRPASSSPARQPIYAGRQLAMPHLSSDLQNRMRGALVSIIFNA
jgi:hypothetical protein